MVQEKQHGKSKRHFPWWLHLLIAILSYSTLKYFLPALASSQVDREQLTELGGQFAPIIAIIFLLLAANGLYRDVPRSTSAPDNPDGQDENDKP